MVTPVAAAFEVAKLIKPPDSRGLQQTQALGSRDRERFLESHGLFGSGCAGSGSGVRQSPSRWRPVPDQPVSRSEWAQSY